MASYFFAAEKHNSLQPMQGHTMNESDRELSVMVQELWDNDVNRLKPGKDYRISLQVAQHFGWDWKEGI